MNKTFYILLIVSYFGLVISCQKDDDQPAEEGPAQYEGWQLAWNDEFDDNTINQANWTYETGDGTDYGLPSGWGNDELQIYTSSTDNSGIMTDDGLSVLAITARSDQSGGYTSAKLTTNDLFSVRFGRVEMKAKLAEGQGLWSAFWMLGDNRDQISWPGCGEIDIVEVLGHEPQKMYSTVHYTNVEHKHGETQFPYELSGSSFSDTYHLFRMDWTPESITYSVDGQSIGTIPIEDDMKEFLRSFYLVLNVAVGGNWPGDPDQTTVFPQSMYVDYIRVYAKEDFQAPEAPTLDIDEETVGQVIEPDIAYAAIRDDFTDLGNMTVVAYGPGEPELSTSDTAINGSSSLVYHFSGEGWGGAYIELEAAVDLSKYNFLKFALHKPDNLTNAEIKLESSTTSTSAAVFLKDYAGTQLSDGFVEYSIPLTDFAGLEFTGITIPFAMWNPQDSDNAFVKARVLIDDVRFE
jgi:beta-glucanase (GH16 family)